MTSLRVIRALSHLYSILEAGEKGYAVAAANVDNRGLKLLFKSYAQQRADFKAEVLAELERHNAARPRGNLLGMLHRGRIDIFAALTIGQENIEKLVIREVLVGEQAALRAYAGALRKDLPAETRALVERQFEALRQVVEQVRRMRGRDGQRLLVRLYDSEADARRAVQLLDQAGFTPAALEPARLDRPAKPYEGRGTSIFETMFSGAVGGALWGSVNGVVAGFTVLQLLRINLDGPAGLTPGQAWALTALACIAGGAFVGGMIGTFIGWGITSGDRYLSEHGARHGRSLVRVTVERRRASEAWALLERVNLEARSSSAARQTPTQRRTHEAS